MMRLAIEEAFAALIPVMAAVGAINASITALEMRGQMNEACAADIGAFMYRFSVWLP